jgi:hypothetical protein
MRRSIETEVAIAAPRPRVWAILMDFESYPGWNPFILSLKGAARVGETLEVVIQPPGHKASTFVPRVLEVEAERRFQWRGSLPIPGLFTGAHTFELTDASGGTRFAQSEAFSGLLVPLLGGALAATEQGFHDMNAALKVRAEGGQARAIP